MMIKKPLVVGIGSLVLAGTVGGLVATGLSNGSPGATKTPVAVIQRTDATTPTTGAVVTPTTQSPTPAPTTTAPVVTTTTQPPVVTPTTTQTTTTTQPAPVVTTTIPPTVTKTTQPPTEPTTTTTFTQLCLEDCPIAPTVVPNVVGDTMAEAQSALEAAGLVAFFQNDNDCAADTTVVIGQSPAVGTVVTAPEITLTVVAC